MAVEATAAVEATWAVEVTSVAEVTSEVAFLEVDTMVAVFLVDIPADIQAVGPAGIRADILEAGLAGIRAGGLAVIPEVMVPSS